MRFCDIDSGVVGSWKWIIKTENGFRTFWGSEAGRVGLFGSLECVFNTQEVTVLGFTTNWGKNPVRTGPECELGFSGAQG